MNVSLTTTTTTLLATEQGTFTYTRFYVIIWLKTLQTVHTALQVDTRQ
jgi:hypothetical protein